MVVDTSCSSSLAVRTASVSVPLTRGADVGADDGEGRSAMAKKSKKDKKKDKKNKKKK
ncbi:hypothetical protein [Actinoplanes sp. M2I2]|uniref:hypothetical protein n=1 Tax=Actinoplanes sp. M2I2 TaxID=1734444 RepID=UPI002022673F|nr:hypothetical protein [Actinoplanes sp. M2I2]